MENLLVWTGALVVTALVVLPYAISFRRRVRADAIRKQEAAALGIDQPKAQYPFIDPTRCIGCGTCVAACPEGDVLGIVGGVATVINGLRCVGHARCEKACPVGAIEVGLGDTRSRSDMPLLDDRYESSVTGVHIVGELGGMALIRFAIRQGREAMNAIAESPRPEPVDGSAADVAIVGAGPAGISAALQARSHGLRAIVLDQEATLGGTILHYPRRKLVLTQPVDIPLWGTMKREEYTKEQLLEILHECVTKFEVDVRFGQRVVNVDNGDELLTVHTQDRTYRARHVILATGRRGSPRKLGVPGEELPKVMYRLIDAEAYERQRILVVGGGDSAVEAATGLATKGYNEVSLSYRRDQLLRVKRKNQERAEFMIGHGRLQPLFGTQVREIREGEVVVEDASGKPQTIENDYVFVFIGGDPPFPLLQRIGIQFGGTPEATA